MKRIIVAIIKNKDVSNIYDTGQYDKPGLYYWDLSGQLALFVGGIVSVIWTDHEIGAFAETDPALLSATQYIPDEVIDTESGSATVSENLFLKTIAILQDSDLITDLIKD